MTKNTWTLSLLAIGVAAGPVLAGGMSAGLGSDIPNVKPVSPVESAVSLLPAALTEEAPMALPRMPSAAKADVQAMLAPRQPIVSVAGDIAKMSGDAASGEGSAIMDRILYIKGTPAAGSAAAPVAGSQAASASRLAPARRGPVVYLLSGPIKVVQASTDYVAKKTKSPLWTAFGFSALNIVGMMKLMVLDGFVRTSAQLSGGRVAAVLGLALMASLYLGYGAAIDQANTERETVRKMNESAAKAQSSLKSVPGVMGVEGETIPGEKSNDHVIIVKVSHLGAANINKIPEKIEGFKVKLQFVR